ncbi:hypothetical protein L1D14_04445 [Vibrio tubiashii]|uniref:hypothetical protein n=1 Tax=Vibrio tubiashii TaxID=29498 RepID=UPI001EFE1A35|nr:hypothetical protein [Vibrio tubiashii]MCG9575482.1 hypothetical protein [Vibrio tubiashii]
MCTKHALIAIDKQLPQTFDDEVGGVSSCNVIVLLSDGAMTLARINHSLENWFDPDSQEELNDVVAWQAIETCSVKLDKMYDSLHETYGFLVDYKTEQRLEDCVITQCSSDLNILHKEGSYDELLSLGYAIHEQRTIHA